MEHETLTQEELIEHYKSDVEDLKFHFAELLTEYATVCSGEGLGNKLNIIETWGKKVRNYPTVKL